jgi:hypothetical protein
MTYIFHHIFSQIYLIVDVISQKSFGLLVGLLQGQLEYQAKSKTKSSACPVSANDRRPCVFLDQIWIQMLHRKVRIPLPLRIYQ